MDIKKRVIPVSAAALLFWCVFRSVGFMAFVAFVAGATSMFCVFAVLLIVYLKNESKANQKIVTVPSEILDTATSPTKEPEPVKNPYKPQDTPPPQTVHNTGEIKNPYHSDQPQQSKKEVPKTREEK
jgi:hypothetical protein